MSYLIVDDLSEERIRYTGNIINMKKRHCRIGKVTPKPPKRWAYMKPTGWHPSVGAPQPWFVRETSAAEHLSPAAFGVCIKV